MRLKITKRVNSAGFITWWAEAAWRNSKATFYATDRHTASWNAVELCFWDAINKAWNGVA